MTFDGDSDPDMTKVVPARIAAAMYASDLTSDDTIGGHGDTGAYGYSNQPWGGWTLENDPTVHGEVISPPVRHPGQLAQPAHGVPPHH